MDLVTFTSPSDRPTNHHDKGVGIILGVAFAILMVILLASPLAIGHNWLWTIGELVLLAIAFSVALVLHDRSSTYY